MSKWQSVFGKSLRVIGMIHVPALPGTPKNSSSVREIVRHVLKETDVYMKAGIDSVLVENMHDIPYLQSKMLEPEITSAMTRVCSEIRRILPASVPCGVQILACGNKEALAVALASDLQFIRCEGFVYCHVADEGWTDSCAAELLRYRRIIGADDIMVLTDIKKKHSSHVITGDIGIEETAAAAEFFLSDGLILTGTSTGHPASATELRKVKAKSSLPVVIGSGITKENMREFSEADAFIVGSHFKRDGRWDQELLEENVRRLMEDVKKIRK